ncbi:MAG TPA: hypothetical protein ENK18_17895 [Deltaproteobacteria bacterium]|nr:hypothetical protein [Deltaproteobacteria bacterium]
MAVRQRLSSMLRRAMRDPVEPEAVDLSPIEARLRSLEARSSELEALLERAAALEEAQGVLEKQISMSMGAIQAATAQLVLSRDQVNQALNQAQQAAQRATTAQATAEAIADGVSGVESRLDALTARIEAPTRADPGGSSEE